MDTLKLKYDLEYSFKIKNKAKMFVFFLKISL